MSERRRNETRKKKDRMRMEIEDDLVWPSPASETTPPKDPRIHFIPIQRRRRQMILSSFTHTPMSEREKGSSKPFHGTAQERTPYHARLIHSFLTVRKNKMSEKMRMRTWYTNSESESKKKYSENSHYQIPLFLFISN